MPPLVTLTLFFSFGIIVCRLAPLTFPFWLGAAVFALAVGLLCLSRTRRRGAVLALIALTFLGGGLRTSLALLPDSVLEPLAGSHVTLEGLVVRPPEESEAGTTYVLAVRLAGTGQNLLPARGLVLVRDLRPGQAPAYQYGDILRVRGVLARPRPAGNFGEFDYRSYLEQRGIAYTLPVYEPNGIERVGSGAGNRLAARLYAWREEFLKVAKLLPREEEALLLGIVFGGRRSLPGEVVDFFTASGTVHLLAVSGSHVGVVAALALGVTRLLRLPLLLQALTAAVAIGLYVFWTGAASSAVRAGLMFLLGLLGLVTGRPRNGLVALAAAALLILLFNPLLLFDIGFQLSFAATLGILWLTPPFLGLMPRRWTILTVPVVVSLAAQLMVWPLTAYYFSGVSPLGFLASLVALPVAGLALVLGVLGLLAGVLYLPLGKVVLGAAGLALLLLKAIARLFASLPFAYLYLKQPPSAFLVVYYLALLGLPWALGRWPYWPRLRRSVLVSAVTLLLIVAWRGTAFGPAPLSVDFLAVGQGDAILIRAPSGQAALIDVGPRQVLDGRVWDAGESIVLPYLRSQGVHRLEVLFLTHGDVDHAGGAPAVLAGLPVGAVIAPPGFDRTGPSTVLDQLREKGIPLYTASRGFKVNLGQGVELTVYGPPATLIASDNPENDNSLIIYLHYGASGFLFMGDAGETAEKALLAAGVPQPVQVLKVAHHGSAGGTGEELLEKTQPKIAVISVGKNNFGHPSPATVGRLMASGATVFRTDQVGQVRVLTDGKKIRVITRRKGGEDAP